MPNHPPDVDEHNVYELRSCIENDAGLYRQQFIPIVTNLMKKRVKGTYDPTKAAKLFGYLADSGAKKCGPALYGYEDGRPWHKQFPVPDRRAVARELEADFRAEADLGNYDGLLKKKGIQQRRKKGMKQRQVLSGMFKKKP